jgi:hypothetical protein
MNKRGEEEEDDEEEVFDDISLVCLLTGGAVAIVLLLIGAVVVLVHDEHEEDDDVHVDSAIARRCCSCRCSVRCTKEERTRRNMVLVCGYEDKRICHRWEAANEKTEK